MVARSLRSTAIQAVNFYSNRVGYTGPADNQFWLSELRKEAENSFTDVNQVQEFFRRNMTANYNRFVKHGGFVKWNKGLDKNVVKRLEPLLQAELNKHINVSRQLVEANRQKAMAELSSRFLGWASSVPVTGLIQEQKNKIRTKILNPLKVSAENERRILRDQNNKLTSALNSVIAMNRGAIAGLWHSRWRDPGYNYREDHKERDEIIYLIRGSWAEKEGLVCPAEDGYTDQITQPGEEYNCKCHYTYFYKLQDLPPEMLTAKGIEAILGTEGNGAA